MRKEHVKPPNTILAFTQNGGRKIEKSIGPLEPISIIRLAKKARIQK